MEVEAVAEVGSHGWGKKKRGVTWGERADKFTRKRKAPDSGAHSPLRYPACGSWLGYPACGSCLAAEAEAEAVAEVGSHGWGKKK